MKEVDQKLTNMCVFVCLYIFVYWCIFMYFSGFMGCVVNLQGLVIEPWSKVVVKSSTGKLTMILYSTGQVLWVSYLST